MKKYQNFIKEYIFIFKKSINLFAKILIELIQKIISFQEVCSETHWHIANINLCADNVSAHCISQAQDDIILKLRQEKIKMIDMAIK